MKWSKGFSKTVLLALMLIIVGAGMFFYQRSYCERAACTLRALAAAAGDKHRQRHVAHGDVANRKG